MAEKSKIKFPSELRLDPLSDDWVIIAAGRGMRPETFGERKVKKYIPPEKSCPLCHIDEEKSLLAFSAGRKAETSGVPKNWTTVVIQNKYPALVSSYALNERTEGPHKSMDGVGRHEVVITRDHRKSLALLSLDKVKEVIDAFQERYLDLMQEPLMNYISVFHNHGVEAGASIFHPHSQIIAAPIIDPDLNRALVNSRKYFRKHKKCIYCLVSAWDKKDRKRIVFENEEFLVICPFSSKIAFEMIISPKKHLPYFERISHNEKKYLAEAMHVALRKLYKGLNDPPYNFYLHTAPCDGKNYDFYHWHWTILPKTSTWAGFELGAGIEISAIEPERAAEFLRRQSYDL